MEALAAIGILTTGIALFLISAKTHGRQLRLERELHGYPDVDFRRATANAPWVEALWTRDRRAYWTIAAASAALWLLLWLIFQNRLDTPLWLNLVLLPLLSMTVAFAVQAARSFTRFNRQRGTPADGPIGPSPKYDDPEWIRRAYAVSFAWFAALDATIGLLATLLAVVGFR